MASGIFLLLFYIFISESGCSFIVSQQMICLVGKELQSFFLHVYVLPKKNKETNSVVWLDNNKHLIVNFFSLLLHRFGGITLLRLYFYKQNIYLGRLRTAKNLTTQGCKIVKAPGFWDQTAFNSLARLIEELIKMFTGLKFYENIQIMTPFLNLDQLFQISFLHIPFFSFFLFLTSSSTFHLRCWFQ